jgi:hypothetical protein
MLEETEIQAWGDRAKHVLIAEKMYATFRFFDSSNVMTKKAFSAAVMPEEMTCTEKKPAQRFDEQ